jgi:hypothetical protein
MQIYEYSRRGVLLTTINDALGYPAGCAIDPKTGDLAVTNILDSVSPYRPGSVLIYKHATGMPKVYSGRNLFEYFYDSYDSNGNLYVDRCASTVCADGGTFQLAELPKHGKSINALSVSGGTVYFPAMVQWYAKGNDLLVGDQKCGGAVTALAFTKSTYPDLREQSPMKRRSTTPRAARRATYRMLR